MTYPTFNPSLQPETANITEKVRENTNEFGDGYAQSVKDGINAVYVESMELSWPVLTYAQGVEIRNFFAQNAGGTFLWTLPGEATTRKWRCSEWRLNPARNASSMSATLREVFA